VTVNIASDALATDECVLIRLFGRCCTFGGW